MSRLPIYHNPQTPAHWRAVLNAIDTNLRQDDAAITDLEIRVTILEAIVGGEGTSSGAVSTGTALYAPSAGLVEPAQADAFLTSRVIGFATATTVGPGVVPYQSVGIIDMAGITANTRYFLSAVTPGLIVDTPDAGPGEFFVPVGWGVDTDRLLFVPHTPFRL